MFSMQLHRRLVRAVAFLTTLLYAGGAVAQASASVSVVDAMQDRFDESERELCAW